MDRQTLADLVGRSESHISNVENGHRRLTVSLAAQIAEVLGTNPARYTHRGGDES